MKKLTLFSLLQIFIVIASAQNLSNNRTNLIKVRRGDITYKSQKDYVMNDEFSIVIAITGTTNDAGCNPSASAINAALGSATASGDCGTPTLTSTDEPVVSSGCDRSQTRTWTATDACGDFVTGARTVVWKVDVTPPGITTSGTTNNLGCNPSSGDIDAALGSAFASDACSPVSGSIADGEVQSVGCNRSQTRTWTATDACGNFTSVSRTVTWVENTSSPIGTVSGTNPNLGCNPSTAAIDAALGTATANTSCGPVQLTVSDGPILSSGCDRSQRRTFTATDNCRSATAVRMATWTEDLTPPTISPTPDITQPADPGQASAHVNIVVSTGDNCAMGGSFTAIRSDNLPITDPYPVGTTTITYTATDQCGNFTTRTQTVTITDTQAPLITYCPALTPQCFISNSTYAIPNLLASDNTGIVSVSYTITGDTKRSGATNDASGLFNPGISTINWVVTDGHANIATCSTSVVIDKIVASIPDAFADNVTPAIGSPNTIYIGYGGKSITLTSNVLGSINSSYSYKWTIGSPGGTKIGTDATVTVSPTETTTYYLSIKDQYNCSQTTQVSKQIIVNDIRCGVDKVFICESSKNGTTKTVCISPSKVTSEPAGSYLGQCTGTITRSRSGTDQKPEPTGELIGSLSKLPIK